MYSVCNGVLSYLNFIYRFGRIRRARASDEYFTTVAFISITLILFAFVINVFAAAAFCWQICSDPRQCDFVVYALQFVIFARMFSAPRAFTESLMEVDY